MPKNVEGDKKKKVCRPENNGSEVVRVELKMKPNIDLVKQYK